jgi:c-di-GMP-binding flagellar brake protein YcgR
MVTGGPGHAPDPAAAIVGSAWDVFGRRRRRARRERAGWLGRYASVTRPDGDWSCCRVLDVSTGGAGLELLGVTARIGEQLVVDVKLVRSAMACVTLLGEVCHVVPTPGGVRVGVRFVDVGELEQALLRRLVARQKHERRHGGVVVPLVPSRVSD